MQSLLCGVEMNITAGRAPQSVAMETVLLLLLPTSKQAFFLSRNFIPLLTKNSEV
jgi:hypothetical protein